MMYTAGSNAVTSYYKNLRVFGAQARRVLLDNAAKKLGVPVEELSTEPSIVVHARSGRKLTYGEIAAFAEVPVQAPEVKPEELKKPADFRLISKDVMRAELPHKINGSAQYAIDVQVPGMLYGAVVRAPVEGAAPEKFDEAKVMMIKGVVKTVKLPYGVGVIAETPWAAFAARGAVEASVSWTKDGKAWGFDSENGLVSFAATARDPNAKATDWFKLGDARAEMPKAASTFEAEYLCDYAYHAQMEPLNGVASVSPTVIPPKCGAAPRARPWRSRRPPRRLVSTAIRSPSMTRCSAAALAGAAPATWISWWMLCCCQRPSASR